MEPKPLSFDHLNPEVASRLNGMQREALRVSKPFDHGVILRLACKQGHVASVKALLDMGLDPSFRAAESPMDADRIPLSWAFSWTQDTTHRADLPIVQTLLAYGADPNRVYQSPAMGRGDLSGMHAAVLVPEALRLLMEHGGKPQVGLAEKWGLLDHWLWGVNSLSKKGLPDALRCLQMLIDAGLDPASPLQDGSAFLVRAWATPLLRPKILDLIGLEFDPFLRGTAQGHKTGMSLWQHLEKKLAKGEGGAWAREVWAELESRRLTQATPAVSRPGKPPRL